MPSVSVDASDYCIVVTKSQALAIRDTGVLASYNATAILDSERNLVSATHLIWNITKNGLMLVNSGKGVSVTQDVIDSLILLDQETRLHFIQTL